jgi:hypothetical protein
MDTAVLVILVGVVVAGMGILVLRMGRKVALFLLTSGSLVVVSMVALALLSQAEANRQMAKAATEAARAAEIAAAGQAGVSAAQAVVLFLVTTIAVLVLAILGAAAGWQLWKQHQRRQRYEEMLQRAWLYALSNGARLPRSAGREANHQLPQAGGNVIVFPGGGQPHASGITLDDLARALREAQGGSDPLAGLLPPDEWEVLR